MFTGILIGQVMKSAHCKDAAALAIIREEIKREKKGEGEQQRGNKGVWSRHMYSKAGHYVQVTKKISQKFL